VSDAASAETFTLIRNARQLLTLRGPGGPRSGPAMAELGIVPGGALLIHNGVIREAGPTRRVENLAEARNAREIDATGRVVMPAFVDADVALVNASAPNEGGADSIRLMSRRRVLARAAARSEELARYGCLAAGAHTRCAADLKNISRLLRVHRIVQRRPMRIRSIFAPIVTPDLVGQLTSKWLPAVMNQKLAAVLELTVGGPGNTPDIATMREVVVVAAGFGYAIRLRSPWRPEPAQLELALEAGAVGVVAPMDSLSCFASRLTEAGTIRVIPVSQGDDCAGARRAIRCAIGQGAAVALSSSVVTLNMQHVLWLGVQNFGLMPEEAIIATTWNAAYSLRLSRVIGSLAPGKSADLLVMDVDDYRDLGSRAGHSDAGVVMRDGQIVHRNPTPRMDSGSALSLD
jgi:imidazolonepropionase